MDFVGQSLALSKKGLDFAGGKLAVGPAEIWSVLTVETSGCGFLPDRRPRILFERHIFSRLTNRIFDVRDVSDPQAGGYGAGGANQYSRLAEAIALGRLQALQSASWGLAQIMGMNFGSSGFAGVEAMVQAMVDSEDAQLAAFTTFLRFNGFERALQSHDWTKFAKGYNGPNFAINRYDEKLRDAFQKFSTGPLPDLDVRTAQMYLTYAGKNPGPVDGVMGTRTRDALKTFQRDKGLPETGVPDSRTLSALIPAPVTV